uniref:RBD domain-containing protein n=1 Tax=Parascaris equorum TaxID=6256 RepID=A0A914RI07_PAREQ
MELDRRLEQCSTFSVEYVDEEGRVIDTIEKVQPLPRQKLHECLDRKLRRWGLSVESVAFFVENSRTPLPDNCDAAYLAGHRIVVRGIKRHILICYLLLQFFMLNTSEKDISPFSYHI